jgi:hypothetical protein
MSTTTATTPPVLTKSPTINWVIGVVLTAAALGVIGFAIAKGVQKGKK